MATYIRKSANALNKSEQDAYIKGVTELVAMHSNMKHRMHTMGSYPLGRLRFLPWHRAYLLHMETELRKKVSDAFIPCWNSTLVGVPDWIKGFQPEVDIRRSLATKLMVNSLMSLSAIPITQDMLHWESQ